ncbi:hypothetical protein BDF20DRAFT_908806 [Mycotypha africana]|uniref:uncharacterized protein n=1 Tax=Mycotypha africana TaxID=64632 RepID=UPI0022FFFC33|nr:uncharacterized protein BDF20DRAFT_908806 [Mycotypha africana]KAI8990983.1 hypothetical protein BDF20DRAFT_908806 [Mycotypha africana]
MLSSFKAATTTNRCFINKASRHISARSIWTKVTATGPTSRECAKVAIDSVKGKDRFSTAPDICVALISKSFTLSQYQDVLHDLDTQLHNPKILIGGVIDRVPELNHGVSLLLGYNEKVVPFFIKDDQQRLKVRNISVGRWGRVDDRERIAFQNDYIDTKGWGKPDLVSSAVQEFTLPEGLSAADQTPPSFIFMLSDNEPEQLLHTLDHHYPEIPKLGIVGASTPFITGTPYTLFKSAKEIVGSGIVGFASYNNDSSSSVSNDDVKINYTAIEKLGEPMKITRCQGNVILDVEQGGPTGLLLRLIQNRPKISKDEEFYLGVYPSQEQNTASAMANMTVNKITSGDPGRGSMSIDTTATLKVGQMIQFFTKKSLGFKNVSSDLMEKEEIALGVSGKDFTIDATVVEVPKEPKITTDVFGGVSENGIIVGRKSAPTQLLDVPYSRLSFKL